MSNITNEIQHQYNLKEYNKKEKELELFITEVQEFNRKNSLLLESNDVTNIQLETIWQGTKNLLGRGLSKVGLQRVGSGDNTAWAFSKRGKALSAQASQEMQKMMSNASNAAIKNLDTQIKNSHPDFPNMKDENQFDEVVASIASLYDSVQGGAGKQLSSEQANSLITALRQYISNISDFKLNPIYKSFRESKEQRSIKLLDLIKERENVQVAQPSILRTKAGQTSTAYDKNRQGAFWKQVLPALSFIGVGIAMNPALQAMASSLFSWFNKPDPQPPQPKIDDTTKVDDTPVKSKTPPLDVNKMKVALPGGRETNVDAFNQGDGYNVNKTVFGQDVKDLGGSSSQGNASAGQQSIVNDMSDDKSAELNNAKGLFDKKINPAIFRGEVTDVINSKVFDGMTGPEIQQNFLANQEWMATATEAEKVAAESAARISSMQSVGGPVGFGQDVKYFNQANPTGISYTNESTITKLQEADDTLDSKVPLDPLMKAQLQDEKNAAAIAAIRAEKDPYQQIKKMAMLIKGLLPLLISQGTSAAVGAGLLSSAAVPGIGAVLASIGVGMIIKGAMQSAIRRHARARKDPKTGKVTGSRAELLQRLYELLQDVPAGQVATEDPEEEEKVNPVPINLEKSLSLLNKRFNDYFLNIAQSNVKMNVKAAQPEISKTGIDASAVGKEAKYKNKKGEVKDVKILSIDTAVNAIGKDKTWSTDDDVKGGKLAQGMASVAYIGKDGKFNTGDDTTFAVPVSDLILAESILNEVVITVDKNLVGVLDINLENALTKLSSGGVGKPAILKFKEFYTQLNSLVNNKEANIGMLASINDPLIQQTLKNANITALRTYNFQKFKNMITIDPKNLGSKYDLISLNSFMSKIVSVHQDAKNKASATSAMKLVLKEQNYLEPERNKARILFGEKLQLMILNLILLGRALRTYLSSGKAKSGEAVAQGSQVNKEAIDSQPMKMTSEGITYLKNIIKEELKHYDKIQFKNIGKSKVDKVEKDKMAEEIKVDDKKAKFLEDINNLVIEYNNTKLRDNPDEFLKKLMEIGKYVKAKKDVIMVNLINHPYGRKVYAYDIAKMLQDCEGRKGKSETYEVPSADKKGDPEKAKEVKDASLEKSNVKITMGNSEKASGKPKGIKVMGKNSK